MTEQSKDKKAVESLLTPIDPSLIGQMISAGAGASEDYKVTMGGRQSILAYLNRKDGRIGVDTDLKVGVTYAWDRELVAAAKSVKPSMGQGYIPTETLTGNGNASTGELEVRSVRRHPVTFEIVKDHLEILTISTIKKHFRALPVTAEYIAKTRGMSVESVVKALSL